MANKKAATVLYLIVCVLGFSARGASQVSVPPGSERADNSRLTATPGDSGVTIKVNVSSVALNASVRDRVTNRSIGGLQAYDFLVYEDGVLQELQQTKITENPFNILLLMDVSGSTRSFMKLMKKAAANFLHEISEKDMVAVASFNSKVRLVQDFTSDIDKAADAISDLRSGGGTAFYDALMTCVDQYLPRVEGRKAIVVFTDGVDNLIMGGRGGSRTSFSRLYARLQESDALIYTVFLNTKGKNSAPSSGPDIAGGSRIPGIGRLPLPTSSKSPFPEPFPPPPPPSIPIPKVGKGATDPEHDEKSCFKIAHQQLEEIAQLTGGRTYSPLKIQELSGAYAEIADDLRIQYLLSYASSNTGQGNGWRSIRVEIQDHPEAVVRTRRGYAVSRNWE